MMMSPPGFLNENEGVGLGHGKRDIDTVWRNSEIIETALQILSVFSVDSWRR